MVYIMLLRDLCQMFSFLNSAMNNTTQRYLNYERGRGDLKTY